MTREEIIRMARECIHDTWNNGDWFSASPDSLVRFAALVAAHERELCARVCLDMNRGWCSDDHMECAAAIRARGREK